MIIPIDHFSSGEYLYNLIISPVCKKYELTHMEFTVLIFLANNPQYDTASEILKIRRLTKSHVSVSVRSLEEKGLLKGEYRDRNRRTVHLSLTDKANPIIRDGRIAQDEFFNTIFKGFSEEEKEELKTIILKIDKNIKDGIKMTGEDKNGRQ